MNSFSASRKRGRPHGAIGNGGVPGSKRSKETDSSQPGLGSKSKPCTKFFSTAGCPFGEACHFLHYVPGGYTAVSQMTNLGGNPASSLMMPGSRNPAAPSHMADGHQAPAAKTRMCNKFATAEGCKFGDKCHFAHGERELGRPFPDDPMAGAGRAGARFYDSSLAGLRGMGSSAPAGAAASFGASATAKISVDASLAGAIIGKSGVNTKQICRLTGAKLSIREHESDQNLRNIELEGTFDQIKQATGMVRELIINIGTSGGPPAAPPAKKATAASATGGGPGYGPGSTNYKTKLCDNFTKGACTFGDRCHFAHGAPELRKSIAP